MLTHDFYIGAAAASALHTIVDVFIPYTITIGRTEGRWSIKLVRQS